MSGETACRYQHLDGCGPSKGVPGGKRIVERGHPEPGPFQRLRERMEDGRVIVNNHYSGWHLGTWFRRSKSRAATEFPGFAGWHGCDFLLCGSVTSFLQALVECWMVGRTEAATALAIRFSAFSRPFSARTALRYVSSWLAISLKHASIIRPISNSGGPAV
jgi:hypothetical protein